MYAIIRASGHQEKVSPGEVIVVNRLKQAVGDQITFVPLVVSKDDGTVITDKKALEGNAKVVGAVREHVKGDKVDIYQYRQKTGYRRHTGHRQPLTVVEIVEIQVNGETFRAPEPEPEPETPAADEPATAGAKATGKTSGAKGTAKAKKTAAKGTAKAKKTAKTKAEPKKQAAAPAEPPVEAATDSAPAEAAGEDE